MSDCNSIKERNRERITSSTIIHCCLLLLLSFFISIVPFSAVHAQASCSGVPTYTIDFSGNPSGTFTSPTVQRAGNCCGTTSPDRCLHFDIQFDSLTAAVNFQITSGAVPPGSLYYQIDCGAPTTVGVPACITGSLHHDLTFCKPGNNTNGYTVTSIPQVVVFPKLDSLRVGCSKTMRVVGVVDSTIAWTSIYPGATGAYNSYLSCTSKCTIPTFTPLTGSPSYIDYQISGYPQATGCGYGATVYDTVRMYVYPQLNAPVSPNPASYCIGSPGTALVTTANGGNGGYTYIWKNGSGTTVGTSSSYFASSAGTYSVSVSDRLTCSGVSTSVPVNIANVTLSSAGTNISCNGASNGSGTVSVTGGASPYIYHWSNNNSTSTTTGVGPGTYNVTVTDQGGCVSNASVVLTQPSILTSTLDSSFHIKCRGNKSGRIYTTGAGGTSGYTYLWSPGGYTTRNIIGLYAGTYVLTVTDAKNCTVTKSITLTEPATSVAPVNPAGSATNLNCNNDSSGTASINSALLGGTPPFSYLWNTGSTTTQILSLKAQSYSVTITDANGCVCDTTFNLTQPSPITTSFGNFSVSLGGYNISCPGGSDGSVDFNVDAGGTPGYTFSWNSGAYSTEDLANVPAGVYKVIVTDAHGCTHNDSTVLTQPAVLNPTVTSPLYGGGYNIACKGENSGKIFTSMSGGTPSYSYSWSGPNGFTGTDSNMVKLYAGFYSVTITDASGCTKTKTITLTEPATIVPLITKATINGVNIRCFNGSDGLAWVDTVFGGTSPFTFTWDNAVNNDSLENASFGTHTLHIRDVNGCVLDTSLDLNQPDPVISQLSTSSYGATEVSCHGSNDGFISVDTVIGGVTPYLYSWSTGESTPSIGNLSADIYSLVITDANGCNDSAVIPITEPDLITVNGSTTDILCSGSNTGSVDINVFGGYITSDYSYLWAPTGEAVASINNLTAGNYCLHVTDDNGCATDVCYTLTEPSPLAIVSMASPLYPGGNNVSCNGGTNGNIYSTEAGGVTPYYYYWSNGDTTSNTFSVSVFTYYLTVTDANGCMTRDSITIDEPPSVVTSVTSQTDVACYGDSSGSITFETNGGLAPYNYSLDGTTFTPDTFFNNLSIGNYTLTSLDANGCTGSTMVSIVQPPGSLNANLVSQTNVDCHGASTGGVNVTALNGASPYQFSIDNVSFQPNGVFNNLIVGNYTVTVRDTNGCVFKQPINITEPNSALVAPSIATHVSCFGGNDGSVSLAVAGGTSSYQYNWSTGDTQASVIGLPADTYTCTVTDANNCTATANVIITEPSLLTVGSSHTDGLCNGDWNGTVTVSAGGGTSSYMYDWSPVVSNNDIATGLHAGTYTCTITDANNCKAVTTEVVSEPVPLSAISSQTNVACNGGNTGMAIVGVSGGSPGYLYNWSSSAGTDSSASSLVAGTYVYNITDANGCIYQDSVTITEPPVLLAVSNQSDVLCYGGNDGSAAVAVSGGVSNYFYNWSPSAGTDSTVSNLIAGTYAYTVTDANGCIVQSIVTISQPDPFEVIPNQADVLCNGGNTGSASVEIGGATPAYFYSWSSGGGTDSVATGLAAGTYVCTITDANGCTITSATTITEPSALTVVSSQTDILCNGNNTGDATVTVNGGVSSYIYSWSSGGTDAMENGLSAATYACTITDANGCTIVSINNITEPSVLSVISNQTDVLCNGGNSGSVTVTANGGVSNYTYSWSPSAGTDSIISNLVAGTYAYTVSDANGCTIQNSVTVAEPTPLAVTANQANAQCNGANNGNANLTVSGGVGSYIYGWSPAVSVDSTASNLVAGTYTFTITDANNCTIQNSINITEPSALTVGPTETNVLCNGTNTGDATVAVSGGVSNYAYSWSSGGTDAIENGLSAATYTCTITDANGCTIVSTSNITEPAALIAPYTKIDAVCNGAAGSATINASGGATGYTYNWSPSGGTDSTATGLSASTYTCLITDANNCTATVSITISEASSITAVSSLTDVSCNGGNNGTATITATGGNPNYTYNWSSSAGTDSTVTGLIANTYTCTVTDLNGCTAISSVLLSEPSALTASAVQDSAIQCNSGVTTVTVTSLGGTPGYSGTGYFSVTAGSYSYIVSDVNGCTSSTTITITEPSIVSAASTEGIIFCNGDATTVDITGAGGTVPYNGIGTFTVSAGTYNYTVSDANGCIATVSGTITEPSLLSASTSTGNILCNGGNTTLNVSGIGGTSPYNGTGTFTVAAGSYNYSITDANGCMAATSATVTEPSALFALALDTIPISCNGGTTNVAVSASGGTTAYNGTGSFTVAVGTYNYIVTDANGCTASATVTIDEPSAISGTIAASNTSCSGINTGSATVSANGGTSPYSYNWSGGGNTSATAISLAVGTYTCSITDLNNCLDTVNVTIAQSSAIIVNAGADQSVCGTSATLSAQQLAGQSGLWNLSAGSGNFSDSTSATTQVSGLVFGTNAIVWNITDVNGCKGSDTLVVESYEAVTADGGPDTIICTQEFSGKFQLQAGTPSQGTGVWSTASGNGTFSDSTSSITYYNTPLVKGISIVVWMVTNGSCSSTDTVILQVKDEDRCLDLELPTGFSPNGDGYNDNFFIPQIDQYPDNTFIVFNRWGNEVFKRDNYENSSGHNWEGQNKDGLPLSEGTYYVILVLRPANSLSNGVDKNEIIKNGFVDMRR